MKECHEWSFEEEFFCSKKYIWFLFSSLPKEEQEASNLNEFIEFRAISNLKNPRDLINHIYTRFPYIAQREIEHKIKQIKHLSNELIRRDDLLPIAPHPFCSDKLKLTFECAAESIHFTLNHEIPTDNHKRQKAEAAKKYKPKETFMTANELGRKLRIMYSLNERKSVMIHLFSIIHGKEMREKDIKPIDVLKAAKMPESYVTEINKGIALSEFVELKEKYRDVFDDV